MGEARDPHDDPAPEDLAPRTHPHEPEAGKSEREEAERADPPAFEVPEVLQLEDDRVILVQLLENDPFEVRARVPRRMRERGVLLPTTRLVTFAMARMAIAAKSYTGHHPIEDWVELAIDVSIDDMLDEIRDEERRGVPVPASEDADFYAELADVFGCPELDTRMALVTLNGMSESHRMAFHRVVVQGMTVEAWAEEARLSKREVNDLLREVGLTVHKRLEKRRKARRRKRRL